MIITTAVEIPPRRIADLMVTAIEGGIGYWCKSVKLVGQPTEALKQPWYDDESLYGDIVPPFVIEVVESEPSRDGDDGRWNLSLVQMEIAFQLMQEYGTPKGFHWRDFLDENEDATTADVWFQLAVFGEVVYG